MEYFLLYMLTLVVGVKGAYSAIAILFTGVLSLVTVVSWIDCAEEDVVSSLKKYAKISVSVSVALLFIYTTSPSKEEAIFIAVGGMALQNNVDERVISLLGKTLDMSEEGITYITKELKALNEEVIEKERVNFCEWYQPAADAFDAERAGEGQQAKAALASLFGEAEAKKPDPDTKQQQAEELFK